MATVDDVRQVIEQANAKAIRWYAEGDVESLISLFAEDCWQMPPNTPALVGRNAIRRGRPGQRASAGRGNMTWPLRSRPRFATQPPDPFMRCACTDGSRRCSHPHPRPSSPTS